MTRRLGAFADPVWQEPKRRFVCEEVQRTYAVLLTAERVWSGDAVNWPRDKSTRDCLECRYYKATEFPFDTR